AAAGRDGERAALRAQRLGVPPLLVEQVVREHVGVRDDGAVRDAVQLVEQLRRVDADRVAERRLRQESLDVPLARHGHPDGRVVEESGQRGPHLVAQRLAVLPPSLGRGSLQDENAAPLRRRHVGSLGGGPANLVNPPTRPVAYCQVAATAILSRMRVREPWIGRGGCPGTGRVEPPLEGNWMKTGWKKAIAPLVLVAGAAALAACGGSDSG